MYAGQFGFNGLNLSDGMQSIIRPVHWMTAALGVFCVITPMLTPWVQSHLSKPIQGVAMSIWPSAAFLFSFALIASRGAVPFLYFQF
jgi:alginate O-acetyltransferase complex protein AlgI